MRNRDPRTRLASVVTAYQKALHSGTSKPYSTAAWRLYEAHGKPFGDSGRALLFWLKYERWTTAT